jgi:exopolysaccharide biosynthesis polyprenyl glycosylphosphotransferase
VLIAGTNDRVLNFAEKILTKPQLGYEIVEFIDTEWTDKSYGNTNNGHRFIPIADLDEYMKHNVIDEVVIGLPIKSQYEQYDKIITICMDQGINVRILADFFHDSFTKSMTTTFDGIPIVTLYTGTMENGALLIKRIMDIIVSSTLLILLFPILLMIMLAIKIDSSGPAVFVQERLGLNKRRFNIYKFRTMVQNAEKLQKNLEKDNEACGPVFKISKDPRITKIGGFLRKSSLDELPQLLNVLKGDMSLVGPRPLPVRDYNEFDQRWFSRRFSVRPGITCFWQVKGRCDIPFTEWIELDLSYIDQWSLGLDIKLLLQTIPAVLKASGAR